MTMTHALTARGLAMMTSIELSTQRWGTCELDINMDIISAYGHEKMAK